MIGFPEPPEVRCHDLVTAFDGQLVLQQLNLTVPAGSATTLVGASGAGKTTLLKHVLGLLAPYRGTVTIGGHDVWDSSEAQLREIRRGISALLSGPTLFDGSTYASLTESFDTQQVMDVVFTVGAYEVFAMAMRTFDVQIDDDLRPFT